MEIIALFFPAAISMIIRYRRSEKSFDLKARIIFDYMIWVIINVLLTACTIVYVFGLSEVNSESFCSFPFFTKYFIIAIIFAYIVPYVVEIITKYFEIKMEIIKNEE